MTLQDGAVVETDGAIVETDGAVVETDGSVVETDGAVVETDGSVVEPTDGAVVAVDGSVATPDGAVTTVDAATLPPDASTTTPDGSTVVPDGSVVVPDGSTPATDGSVVVPPDASAIPPDAGLPGNHDPILDPFAPVVVNEGDVATVPVVAADPDGDALVAVLTGAPSWASITGALITLSPGYSNAGTYTFSVIVSDGKGGSDTEALSVTVNDVNRPPVFADPAPVDMNAGSSQIVTLSATDPDGDSVTYSLAGSAPTWASLSGANLTLSPAVSNFGNYSIGLTASDGKGGTDTTTLLVNVMATGNHNPVLGAIADQTLDEAATKTVDLTATDADGDTVTVIMEASAPTWITLAGLTVTLAPTYADSGTYQVTFTATDGKGGSDSKVMKVTVNDINLPPVLDPFTDPVAVSEGGTSNVSVSASDVNGDTLTVTLTGAPSWATVSGMTIILAPGYDAEGSYTIQVTVSDGKGGTATQTLTVNVGGTNRNPVLAAVAPVTVAEGTTGTVNLTASDPDGDSVTVYKDAAAPAWISIAGLVVTLTPGYTDAGTYQVTLTASDGKGGTATQTMSVEVTNVNRAPTMTDPAPVAMDEGATQTVALLATDPDGDTVAFALTGTPPTWATVAGTDLLLAPGYDAAGTYTLYLAADDGHGGVDTSTLAVTVNDVNRAPVFATLTPITMAENTSRTVTLSATDPDGDTVTYSLGAGAPTWASIAGSTLTLAPGYDAAGTHSIPLVASDGKGGTGNGTQSVTVTNVNRQPTISVSNATLDEGTTQTVQATVSDPDNDPLTVTLVGAPAWATISGTTITLSPGYANSGTHTLTAQVDDGQGGTATTTFTVTVNDVNRPPVLGALVAVVMDEGTTKTVTLTATDPDGDTPLTFSLEAGAPSWATILGAVVTLSPGFTNSGTFTVPVKVADGKGGADTDTLSVTVNNVNRAPTINPLTAVTMNEAETRTVALSGSDPDGDPITFNVGAGAPAWAAVAGTDLVLTPGYTNSGTVTFPVEVSDGTLTGSTTITVTVNNVNRPPVLGVIADQTVAELATKTVNLTASDPDGQTLTYSLQAGTPTWITINPTTGVITLAPVTGNAGTYTNITAIVSDGTLTDSQSFDVTVTITNVPPTLSGANQYNASGAVIPAGTHLTVSPVLKATLADPHNNNVKLEAEVVLNATAFSNTPTHSGTLAAPGLHSLTLPSLPVGTYKWQVRATDEGGLSSAWTAYTGNPNAFIIDAQPISGTLVINANAAATNLQFVNLAITATPASGSMNQMRFSNDGTSWSAWEAFATVKNNWFLDYTTEGSKTVYVQVNDTGGNTGEFSDTIIYDKTAPAGTFTINSGALYTNVVGVTLNMGSITDGTGSGIASYEFSNNGSTYTAVTPVSGNAPWTLLSGDGSKTVYGRFTDKAGNVLLLIQTITLDTALPTGTLAINTGDAYTTSTSVTLTISYNDPGSGVYQICYSNDGVTFTICSTPPVGSRAWTLDNVDGNKRVTLRITDNAGNSSTSVFDEIILDRTKPTITQFAANDPPTGLASGYTNSNPTALRIVATDNAGGSGMNQMQFSHDGTTWSAAVPYAADYSWTLLAGDGAKTVWVRVTDNAGNFQTASCAVTLDTVLPTGSISINAGAAWTTNATVTLTLTYADVGTGVQWMQFSTDGMATWTTNETPAGTKSITLPAPDAASKAVYVRYTDRAGNTRTYVDTIGLDTTPPVISFFEVRDVDGYTLATNALGVQLYYTVTDATSGVVAASNRASNDGATYTNVGVSPVAWNMVGGTGTKTVWFGATDVAGNVATLTDTIVYDNTNPTFTAVSINGGATYTNALAVNVGTSAAGGFAGLGWVCLSATTPVQPTAPVALGSIPANCVPYVTPAPFTLATPDGTKTVYARVIDNAGNISGELSDTIVLDQTAPTGTVVADDIAGWTASVNYTNSTSVDLILTWNDANGVSQVCFSNDGTNYSGCVAPTTPVAWTLTTGDGTKTVYARFTDNAGNTFVDTDTIVLDTAPPTGTIVLDGGATYTNDATRVVSATLTRNGGYYQCIKNDSAVPASDDACFVAFTTPVDHTLTAGDGTKTVYMWLRDYAGNVSAVATDTIIQDLTPPTVPSGVVLSAIHRQITATWTNATDATSGVAYHEVGWRTGATPTWETATTPWVKAVPSEWTYYVAVRARDNAGNWSGASTEVSATPRYPWRLEQRGPMALNFHDVEHTAAASGFAIGEGGALYTTTDSFVTMTRRDPMVDEHLYKATTSGGAYVAVGTRGTVINSSTNGDTWVAGVNNDTAVPKSDLYGVTEAGSSGSTYYYVAVGAGGKILTGSRVGASGTLTMNPATSGTTQLLRGVGHCLGAGFDQYVVAAGENGTVLRSTDRGATWTAATLPAGYTATLFRTVAGVPASTTMYLGGNPTSGHKSVLVSPDCGATWTESATFSTALYQVNEIVPLTATDIYMAGNFGSSARVWRWTGAAAPVLQTSPGDTGNHIAYGIDAFDANNWTWAGQHGAVANYLSGTGYERSSGASTLYEFLGVAPVYGFSSRAFAVGQSGKIAYTTDEGATWADQTLSTTHTLYSVAAPSSTLAFAVGYTASTTRNAILAYNGTAWSAHTDSANTTNSMYGVSCWSSAYCVAVGSNSLVEDYSGANWVVSSVGGGVNYRAVTTYYDGTARIAIAVGDGGNVRYGVNSPTTNVVIPGAPALKAVAATPTKAIAVGAGGVMFASTTDGSSWTAVTSGVTTDLNAISNNSGTVWYAAGAGGVILKSTNDGVTWTPLVTNQPSLTLNALSVAPTSTNRIYAAGVSGLVMYSPSAGQ